MICITCKIEKAPVEMQPTLGRNGKVYLRKICKKCRGKEVRVKRTIDRKIVGSHEWWRNKYDRKKHSSKKRNIIFELSLDDFKSIFTLNNCFYCNELPDVKTIDRVDNIKGYTINNCVMACWPCNKLKSSLVSSDKVRMLTILSKI